MRLPTMRCLRVPSFVVAPLLAVAACGSGDDQPAATGDETTTSTSTTSSTIPVPGVNPPQAGECSAAELSTAIVRDQPGLPAPVVTTRAAIIDAALACDFEQLQALAVEGDGTFNYRFGGGAPTEAAEHWRQLEADGDEVLRMLVETLQLPSVATGDGTVVWPSAHQENPSDEDWDALRALYDDEQIESWRSGGTGFLGYRVGITQTGDWQYFIAGD